MIEPSSFLIGALAINLAVIAWTDMRDGLIRNVHNASLAALGLLYQVVEGRNVVDGLAGAALGMLVLLGLNAAYRQQKGRDGLGYGDIKFMVGGGIWVGWQGVAPLLLVASIAGVVSAVLTQNGRHEAVLERQLRFGPCLCLALMLVFLAQRHQLAPWLVP